MLRTNLTYPQTGPQFVLDVQHGDTPKTFTAPATSYNFKTRSKTPTRIWGDLHIDVGDVVDVCSNDQELLSVYLSR